MCDAHRKNIGFTAAQRQKRGNEMIQRDSAPNGGFSASRRKTPCADRFVKKIKTGK